MFDDGEIAYIAVVLVLYVLLLCYACFKLGRAIYLSMTLSGKIHVERLLVILMLITVFSVCMLFYFLFPNVFFFSEILFVPRARDFSPHMHVIFSICA